MNSHLQRWITAVVAVPALFALVFFGSAAVFSALILLVVVVGIREYNALVFGPEHRWEKMESIVLAVLVPAVFYVGNPAMVLAVVSLAFLTVFFLYLPHIRQERFDVVPVMKVVFGLLYIPVAVSYLIWIRQGADGALWIFFVIVLAFSGDVAAYYVGTNFGKRKLIPLVSAGKSVEGTIALIIGSTVCCVIYAALFLPGLPLIHAAVLGCAGSTLGQLGDLCESAIKRASGVKDSGSILPGHGGILDRLDCLIFIGPFTYYYRLFVVS